MNANTVGYELSLNQDEFEEILGVFVETIEPAIVELNIALKDRDLGRMANIAGAIKGAAATLGFMEFVNIASEVEQSADNSDQNGVGIGIIKLKYGLNQIVNQSDGGLRQTNPKIKSFSSDTFTGS